MGYTPTTYVNSTSPPIDATNLNKIERQIDVLSDGGFYVDSYSGTDQQRLQAALLDQQASGTGGGTNMAPVILPCRPMTLTAPITMYSGMKIIGSYKTGQNNPELSSGNFSGTEITMSGTLGSGTNSLFVGTGTIYNVFLSDFCVQGSQGSNTHQFLDHNSGTLYACELNSLSFNFMKGVMGNSTRKCFVTQVCLTGTWTANNAWETQFHLGGSDCTMWLDSLCNIGVTSSAAQTGGLTSYFMKLDSLEGTLGKAYVSAMNGWRGILISGSGTILTMVEGVYEGYKPTGTLLSGPAPGSVVKITGGAVTMLGTKMGQGMNNPDASEGGLLDVSGGEVSLFGCNFYGQNMGSVNALRHTGGRVSAVGITRRQNDLGSWSGRPRYTSPFGVTGGADSFYMPDQSMQVL